MFSFLRYLLQTYRGQDICLDMWDPVASTVCRIVQPEVSFEHSSKKGSGKHFVFNVEMLRRTLWATSCCCSVTQSCLTLSDPMDCSTPGFPVRHHLLEFARTHVHWVYDTTQQSNPLSPPSQSFSPSESVLMSHLFASGGQSIEPSASASVLPVRTDLL